MNKCRNCELMIVDNVNADYSRGGGHCFHRPSCFDGTTGHYKGTEFSCPACRNFKKRTSTLEIKQGGLPGDDKRSLKEIRMYRS